MSINKKYLLSCISSIALFTTQSSITLAATEDGSLTVGSTVAAPACTIGNIVDVVFPEIDFDNPPTFVSSYFYSNEGSFAVTCTSGQSYTAEIDNGLHENLKSNSYYASMVEGSDTTKFIPYLLTNQNTSSVSVSNEWQTPDSFTGDGQETIHKVYGAIYDNDFTAAAGRNITPGATLTDTVTITLTF